MAGIRIGGIASITVPLPDIPILVHNAAPTSEKTLYQIGNLATPVRMFEPIVDALDASGPNLGDPQREPVTGDFVVYSRYNVAGTINRSVRLVDWADTTDIELYADTSGGLGESLQPSWKPDGSRIMFRAKGAGSALNLIKEMDPDGTNVTTLHTGTNTIIQPLYSFDGTKIAWIDGQDLKVADSDGTNVSTLDSATGIEVLGGLAWGRANLIIAYRHDGGTFTSNENWKVINSDGTGAATWLTISRASGYGPSQGDPPPIMYSWLLDDAAIATTVRQLADPDPDARLSLVDAGGSNPVSPSRYMVVDTGSPDTRPAVIAGHTELIERIFFYPYDDGGDTVVASVKFDGTDYRVDFNGGALSPEATFQGFRGDTANV